MDHLEAAGIVAHERGVEQGQGSVVLHPRSGVVVMTLPSGAQERLSYDRLINEAQRIKAAQPGTRPARGQHYTFWFPRPAGRSE